MPVISSVCGRPFVEGFSNLVDVHTHTVPLRPALYIGLRFTWKKDMQNLLTQDSNHIPSRFKSAGLMSITPETLWTDFA
jgi:hypothetical protein